jgi:hypothetical protein
MLTYSCIVAWIKGESTMSVNIIPWSVGGLLQRITAVSPCGLGVARDCVTKKKRTLVRSLTCMLLIIGWVWGFQSAPPSAFIRFSYPSIRAYEKVSSDWISQMPMPWWNNGRVAQADLAIFMIYPSEFSTPMFTLSFEIYPRRKNLGPGRGVE